MFVKELNTGNDGGNHTDVDKCASNNGGCSPSATCIDNQGTITCKCKSGFKGNGHTCTGKIIYLKKFVIALIYTESRLTEVKLQPMQ